MTGSADAAVGPTLFDRIESARQQATVLVKRRGEKDQAKRFEDRGQQLRGPAAQLKAVALHATVLKHAGVAINTLDADQLARWKARLQGLLDEFERDPSSILDPAPGEDARKVLLEPLKQLPSDVANTLIQEWQSWLREQAPAIPSELLDVLSVVPSLGPAVREIRSADAAVRVAGKSLPNDSGAVDAIKATASRLQALWDQLSSGGIPEEVVIFLRAAGQRDGAPYALLTPDVLRWMQQHDLLITLKIRLA